MDDELNRIFNRYIARMLTNIGLSKPNEIYFKQQMRYLQKDITRLQENKGLEDDRETKDKLL